MNNLNTPFSPESIAVFLETISVMLKGMIGIFAFMLIFYALIKILDKVIKEKTE
ncbi:MAG: hypothetical protein FWG98_00955 [Candidatus Cloacimonetes bacterium]|nr:hypothetical protein [Candidatus Cloacimonadota bacterium]